MVLYVQTYELFHKLMNLRSGKIENIYIVLCPYKCCWDTCKLYTCSQNTTTYPRLNITFFRNIMKIEFACVDSNINHANEMKIHIPFCNHKIEIVKPFSWYDEPRLCANKKMIYLLILGTWLNDISRLLSH